MRVQVVRAGLHKRHAKGAVPVGGLSQKRFAPSVDADEKSLSQNELAPSYVPFKQDGFDLDLTYIIDNLMAMSDPASAGPEMYFRDSIKEVSRFFNTRHTNRYLIICCTDEQTPKRVFPDLLLNRIVEFPVERFGVPTIAQIWSFCALVDAFLAKDNKHVVAVQSYNGVGRAGLLLASYLVHARLFPDGSSAMAFFEQRRTEHASGGRCQGVDNCSQGRFVRYFTKSTLQDEQRPTARRAILKRVRVHGLDCLAAKNAYLRIFAHPSPTPLSKGFGLKHDSQDIKHDPHAAFDLYSSQKAHRRDSEASPSAELTPDDILNEAKKATEEADADALNSGALRYGDEHEPLMDTEKQTDKCKTSRSGDFADLSKDETPDQKAKDDSQTPDQNRKEKIRPSVHGVLWDFDEFIVEGEVKFEVCVKKDQKQKHSRFKRWMSSSDVHEVRELYDSSRSSASVAIPLDELKPQEEESSMLLSFWLHSAFLELGADVFLGDEHKFKVLVSLNRFDVDKAANGPSLMSFGRSLEVVLIFEIEPDGGAATADLMSRINPHPSVVSAKYSLGWLNWCIEQIWPHLEIAIDRMLNDLILPSIRDALPQGLNQVDMKEFSLGVIAPTLGPIQACHRDVDENELQLDVWLNYEGDANIILDFVLGTVGIRSIGLRGNLLVRLRPITEFLPLVNGIQLTFLNAPDLSLEFTGLAEVVNSPKLRGTVTSLIERGLAQVIVLPRVFTIDWGQSVLDGLEDMIRMDSAHPVAVLRTSVVQIEQLESGLTLELQIGAEKRCVTNLPEDCSSYDVHYFLVHDVQQRLNIRAIDRAGNGQVSRQGVMKVAELTELGVVHIPLAPDSKEPFKGSTEVYVGVDGILLELTSPKGAAHLVKSPSGNHLETVADGAPAILSLRVCAGRLPEFDAAGVGVSVRLACQHETVVESLRPYEIKRGGWGPGVTVPEEVQAAIQRLSEEEGFDLPRIAKLTHLPHRVCQQILASQAGMNLTSPTWLFLFVPPVPREEVQIALESGGKVVAKSFCWQPLAKLMDYANCGSQDYIEENVELLWADMPASCSAKMCAPALRKSSQGAELNVQMRLFLLAEKS